MEELTVHNFFCAINIQYEWHCSSPVPNPNFLWPVSYRPACYAMPKKYSLLFTERFASVVHKRYKRHTCPNKYVLSFWNYVKLREWRYFTHIFGGCLSHINPLSIQIVSVSIALALKYFVNNLSRRSSWDKVSIWSRLRWSEENFPFKMEVRVFYPSFATFNPTASRPFICIRRCPDNVPTTLCVTFHRERTGFPEDRFRQDGHGRFLPLRPQV